jgi:MoaA/NifB/PqqE/SkfB family radical SAM enzyme
VLESSSHLCCASWLPVSAGNLHTNAWQEVWNSQAAQNVRRSIHDGSYRYCNKMACPRIMAGTLTLAGELAELNEWWKDVVDGQRTMLDRGPMVVNLAYDRTCNLSCPSCRQTVIFQNREQRDRTEAMQDRNILPMLEGAERVMVTGSGDPFSSPMFRKLLKSYDPQKYPKLKINLMTNGMLLTEQCWKEYTHLAGHIAKLKFSLDGATAATHELLRRGSRWERVYEHLKFCGRLLREGALDSFEIVFVVQVENYREMGDFVDLGHDVGRGQHLLRAHHQLGHLHPGRVRA